jgi:hypothetical protein
MELAVDSYIFKLQRLQNKVLRINVTLPRRTLTRDLHVPFQISYLHDFVTELCRQQAKFTQNHENVNIRNIGQGEAQTWCGRAYD